MAMGPMSVFRSLKQGWGGTDTLGGMHIYSKRKKKMMSYFSVTESQFL